MRNLGIACGLAACALMALGASWADVDSESASSGDSEPPPVATSPLASTLIRAGLGPEELAAAGVLYTQIPGIVYAAEEHVTQAPNSVREADAAVYQYRTEVQRLRRLTMAMIGTAAERDANSTAYDQACEDCADAEQVLANRLSALFDAATAELTAPQIATLQAIRGNKRWKYPAEYLVKNREDADWLRLRECLANERTAPRLGEEVDTACSGYLATVRADPAVALAIAFRNSNGTSVENTWNLELSD